ncbi:hypothetical protein SHKM778_13480 [Streptomyces sp. KM77-8]|uniref:ABC3 transporter permease C-terminal domain-containing protein n=1 Tax=Streptomyces haneummycinicus TaxID=3074435 RepID=A0AAT9HCC8_9ACTN
MGQGRDGGDFNQYLVVGGVICLLVGITALLPWIVEAVVARLGAGSLSWQLAVRRLQLSSGAAARMVNGIAVAVAGAIALQMLFTGVDGDYTKSTGYDTSRAQMQVGVPEGKDMASTAARFEETKGVREVYALSQSYLADEPWRDGPERGAQLTVGSCSALREVAKLPKCQDGDVFTVRGGEYDTDTPALSEPGRKLYLETTTPAEDDGKDVVWTLPKVLIPADSVADPTGARRGGFLMTPASVPPAVEREVRGQLYLALDESVPDAREYVRNTAAEIDPLSQPMMWSATTRSERFDSIRTGLFAGAVAVLALIGASLLVSQLEQLRERRKLLSSLIAFGTRRRTLSLSVLWQTAIPIGLGLLLAATVGIALGTVLLRMTATTVTVDWMSVLRMTGVGAGVVLVVTLLSLPPLLRMMRPDGLRTE